MKDEQHWQDLKKNKKQQLIAPKCNQLSKRERVQQSLERFLPVQVVESVSVEAEHWEESWWESGAEVLALGFYSKGRTEQV